MPAPRPLSRWNKNLLLSSRFHDPGLALHGRRKGVAGCNSFESFPGFPLFKLGMNDVMNTHFSIWRWRKKPVPGCSYPQKLHGRGWNILQEDFQHFAFSESRGVRCFLFHDKPREAFYSHWSFESNMVLPLVCDDRKSAKLQNIRLVICISLNDRSAYRVMSRCLKRSDTCGWSGWVLWSWKFSFWWSVIIHFRALHFFLSFCKLWAFIMGTAVIFELFLQRRLTGQKSFPHASFQ